MPQSIQAATPQELELEPLVVREPDRRDVDVDKLDTENFQIGGFAGLLNVEDFGTNLVYGIRATYHVTEGLFVEGNYALSELGQTSFELLSGGATLLTDDQRDLTYYNLSIGYALLPGESFIGSRWAIKGRLYFLVGAGATDFGGDQRFTINGGVGYELYLTDWLAMHVAARDHVFSTDLLGTSKTVHNVEFTGGLSVYF
ncbi:MAG: outer membrane beta-barrel domain-containing protein [Pseudomonadales bacterium]|nr:outer membrane beta-barrel domain-containing protein [Pseudomonadales bacterium]